MFYSKLNESIHPLAACLTGNCFLSIYTCDSKQMLTQLGTAATAVLFYTAMSHVDCKSHQGSLAPSRAWCRQQSPKGSLA